MSVLSRFSRKVAEKFQTLKFKLMFFITLLLIVVVGLPLGFFVYQLDRNYKDFSINMIETASQVVYQYIFDGMMKNDSLMIQKNLELLAMEPTIQLVRIYRPCGTILFSSRKQEILQNIRELGDSTVFLKINNGEIKAFVRRGNVYSHHHPIYIQEECTPCHQNKGELIAIMDIHTGFTQSEQLYASSKKLVLVGGILIIAILWIALNLLYQSQIESRLQTIIRGFERLRKGDFSYRIKMPGRHELALLAEKFNHTVEELKASREKEEQLLQEKLERADRLVTLGEVAAEIAHEVNNPASIILARAEFLREEFQTQGIDHSCTEDLDIIIKQIEKIAETTRGILHYARKRPTTFSQTNLCEVIQQSLRVLEPRIKKLNVEVALQQAHKPAIVWGNFNQLEQVFCNLLNNSLDVLEKYPRKKISLNCQEIIEDHRVKKYRIILQDSGPGIPPEYRDKIFTPFFTTKAEGKGTGLGLFIARKIITNHKGNLYLDATNKGAKFIIELEAFHE